MSGTVKSAEDKKDEPVVTPSSEGGTPPSGEDTPTIPTTNPPTPPNPTPPNEGSEVKDDSSFVDDLVYAKNYII